MRRQETYNYRSETSKTSATKKKEMTPMYYGARSGEITDDYSGATAAARGHGLFYLRIESGKSARCGRDSPLRDLRRVLVNSRKETVRDGGYKGYIV